MIWNKSMDFNARVFDMAANSIYDTDEVEVEVDGNPLKLAGFIKDAKDAVKSSYYGDTGKAPTSKKYRYSDTKGWEEDEELMRRFHYMS